MTVGCVDRATGSWAIQALGSASISARSFDSSSSRGARAEHDALAARAVARLDDELVEALERLRALLVDGEVPRRHGAQQRRLAAVEAHEPLDVDVRALVVGDAGPEGVDHPHRAAAQRLEQQRPERR